MACWVEKAVLRQTLETWRGKKFTVDELRGWDLEKLIGATVKEIADLAGVEYERQLSPAQIGMLIRLTNQHLASAWTDFPWPELTSTAPYYMWPNAWDPSAALTQGTVVRLTRGGATAYYKRKTPKASGYGASYALGARPCCTWTAWPILSR